MVRTHKKKRREVVQDFKRVKRRVGRKAPAPRTATNTDIKSRTVSVREQSVSVNKDNQLVSSRNLTIGELRSKLKHHNAGVRRDAVDGLIEIVNANEDDSSVKSQAAVIITTVVELINDEDKQVRVAVRKLMTALLRLPYGGSSSIHWCTPFFKLIMFHICAGLTLTLGRRLDSLELVDVLMDHFSLLNFKEKLLPLYSSLLVTCLGQVGSRNTKTVVAPSASAGVLRSFKQANKKTSEVVTETWFRVAEGLLRLLRHFKVNDTPAHALHEEHTTPKYRTLYAQQVDHLERNGDSGSSSTESCLDSVCVLLTQSLSLYDNSKFRRNSRVKETIKQVEIAAEILYLIVNQCSEPNSEQIVQLLLDIYPQSGPRFVRVNLFLTRTILLITEQENDETLYERVVCWLVSQLSEQGELSHVVPICQGILSERQTWLSPKFASQLEDGLRGLFNAILLNESDYDPEPELLLAAIDSLAYFIESDSVEPSWMFPLPKFIWQGYQSDDEEILERQIGSASMRTLKLAATRSIDADWELLAKRIVPILYIQRKGTSELVPGPFTQTLVLSEQLQVLDLIAMLPLDSLPRSLLRALCKCVFEYAKTEDVGVLLARVVSTPFCFLKSEEGLAGAVSFAMSCLWGNEEEWINDTLVCQNLASNVLVIEAAVPISALLVDALTEELRKNDMEDFFGPDASVLSMRVVRVARFLCMLKRGHGLFPLLLVVTLYFEQEDLIKDMLGEMISCCDEAVLILLLSLMKNDKISKVVSVKIASRWSTALQLEKSMNAGVKTDSREYKDLIQHFGNNKQCFKQVLEIL